MKEETGLHLFLFHVRKINIFIQNLSKISFVVDMSDGMRELISTVTNNVPVALNVQRIENLHISLTKTVILKHHWIDIFIESIKSKTRHLNKFVIFFGSLNVYCNEERTRTFIGLQIRTGYDSLLKLVEVLDECLVDFKLPTFYKVC